MYAYLTDDDVAALKAFAAHKGRTWKSQLRDIYWPNARIWETWKGNDGSKEHGYRLHALRNSHGMVWLASYHLPKE